MRPGHTFFVCDSDYSSACAATVKRALHENLYPFFTHYTGANIHTPAQERCCNFFAVKMRYAIRTSLKYPLHHFRGFGQYILGFGRALPECLSEMFVPDPVLNPKLPARPACTRKTTLPARARPKNFLDPFRVIFRLFLEHFQTKFRQFLVLKPSIVFVTFLNCFDIFSMSKIRLVLKYTGKDREGPGRTGKDREGLGGSGRDREGPGRGPGDFKMGVTS